MGVSLLEACYLVVFAYLFWGFSVFVPVSYEGDDYNHIYITIFRDGETFAGCADFSNYDALAVLQ